MGSAAEPRLLVDEDFGSCGAALPPGWRAEGDGWRVAGGELIVDSLRGQTAIFTGKPQWQNYEITVTATFEKVTDNARWLSVVFRAARPKATPWSHFCLRFGSNAPNGTEFAVRDGGTWRVRKRAKLAEDCRLGQPRRLRVVVRGSWVEAFVDERQTLESPFCLERETGLVGLAASGCVARFDDFHVRELPGTPLLADMPRKPCDVVAHRGFSAVAPENTVAAVTRAIKADAWGSECDVRRSKDGRLVIMHDETVDRTTDGKGKVAELTLAQMKRLDAGAWKNAKYVGERIPTLEELLAAHKNSGCVAVIEIKTNDIERPVIDAIDAVGMANQVAIIAFDGVVVREVRQLAPRLPCAWLCGQELKGTPAERADWIAQQAAVYKTSMVDLAYDMLSRELVDELHRRRLVVWAWTVDDPVIMDALMRWGVESITTNRPEIVLRQQAGGGRKTAAEARPNARP
jgi:glycerophosphoryl diester phosphodiesterase